MGQILYQGINLAMNQSAALDDKPEIKHGAVYQSSAIFNGINITGSVQGTYINSA